MRAPTVTRDEVIERLAGVFRSSGFERATLTELSRASGLQRSSLYHLFPGGKAQRIAYHDACHLANAQGVRGEPRELLRAIPQVELVELADAHLCCGSAGTYNMDQPGIAASLGEQKAAAVIKSGASVVASGNIGCLTQLRLHLARLGSPVTVRHTMQVLRDAYGATGSGGTIQGNR